MKKRLKIDFFGKNRRQLLQNRLLKNRLLKKSLKIDFYKIAFRKKSLFKGPKRPFTIGNPPLRNAVFRLFDSMSSTSRLATSTTYSEGLKNEIARGSRSELRFLSKRRGCILLNRLLEKKSKNRLLEKNSKNRCFFQMRF